MWSEALTTVPAGEEPVTLAEARTICRVLGTEFDTELTARIAEARSFVERWTGLRIVEQTVELKRRTLVDEMPLPVGPVQSVSIEYIDSAGSTQTLSTDLYELAGADTLSATIWRADDANWPDLKEVQEAVTVTAVVGYVTVPSDLKAAILRLVQKAFDTGEMSDASAMGILENYRVH